jgi:hypothetical protein
MFGFLWNEKSEWFAQADQDAPAGSRWAREAIRAATDRPTYALKCARMAVQSAPLAWRTWYDAFSDDVDGVGAV